MKLFLYIIAICVSLSAYSSQPGVKKELSICRLFSDHMVLQRRQKVDVWGHSVPGQKLTVSASWGSVASTITDGNGKWKIKLATHEAGGPYSIIVKTSGSLIVINDVLIGEVWLASGQSNMDLPLKGWPPEDTVRNSKQEIAQANYPNIRLLKVPFNISASPIDSLQGEWVPASSKTAGNFSATAYFYAKKLYQELNVPIGIIQSSIGGTPAEAWTSKESLTKLKDFDQTISKLEKLQNTTESWFRKWPVQSVPRTTEQWKEYLSSDYSAAALKFNDTQWEKIKLPGRFDKLSSGEFDGVIWLRKEFAILDTTTDYILTIGSVDDMAETYINGQKVGAGIEEGLTTTGREIKIPKSMLIKGANTISIRAIDTGGPGFVNGPLTLSNSNGDIISLEGDWKSRLVAENLSGRFYTYNLQTSISERPDISKLNSNSPTVLFNAMIHPLVPYSIKGVIWYQGESNVGRADQYKRLFPAMIRDWRNQWGYEFPFYFVQIAPHLYKASDQKEQSQKLRNAQRYALKLPKTGMAVTLDIGKLTTAHPAYKKEVGDRLARFALANDYGKPMVSSGPLYKKVERKGNQLIVQFHPASVGTGLVASAAELAGFEVAGADKVYVAAEAKIVGNQVIISNGSIAVPVYARYAWSDGFAATLFNREGLPASTFTSED